jgi:hypothetical protein
MSQRIARLEDEKRRKEELASFCRHASAILELLRYTLDQLNPASQPRALAHVRNEIARLFVA